MPACHEDFVLNTKNFQALWIFTIAFGSLKSGWPEKQAITTTILE
jgi:hypothetical protein